MRKFALLSLAALATLSAGAAQAQEPYHGGDRPGDHGGPGGRGGPGRPGGPGGDQWRRSPEAQGVCSGSRAHDLDNQVWQTRKHDGINTPTANRLHQQVAATAAEGRKACARGNWQWVTSVAGRFNGIEHQLEGARRR